MVDFVLERKAVDESPVPDGESIVRGDLESAPKSDGGGFTRLVCEKFQIVEDGLFASEHDEDNWNAPRCDGDNTKEEN